MFETVHYRRIHGRVAHRVWLDLPQHLRDVIAADVNGETDELKWFESKVTTDAMKLYEDPSYYDNQDYTFRVSRRLPKESNLIELPTQEVQKAA